MLSLNEEIQSRKNLSAFTAKESIYVALAPVLWGTIMQQFLLYRGVSPTLVGLYTTLVSGVQMAAMMLLSWVAEKVKDPLKFCTGIMGASTLIAALYLPIIGWDLGSIWTMVLVCVMSVAHLSLHSCKYICDYRINYQIVSPQRYGAMIFLASALTGVAGIGFSALFSYMVDNNTGGNPYFICMLLAVILLAVTVFFNSRLKSIYPVPKPKGQFTGLGEQLKLLMNTRSFRQLLIPNLLRGITLSITGCIVLIALVMGIDESGRAKIPLVCALATALASVVYMLLKKWLSVGAINIIGGVLTCAMIFLPWNNSFGFLVLFFVAYLGRIIVDNAVPTMLFPIIEPEIAGFYNAWRSVLYGVCGIIVTPIISALVEVVHPLWLLTPGALAYLIVTVWYYIVCKRLTVKPNI